jgi:hypothetical protein
MSTVIIYGTNGFVGPITLGTRNTFRRHSTVTRNLRIPDIGNFVEMKITNTGNDGWHIHTASQSWKGATHTWPNDAWLDGNGGYNAPHSKIFSVAGIGAAHPCGSASIFISHDQHSQSNHDIFVYLTGTRNSSRPTLVSTNTNRRRSYTVDVACDLGASDLGTFQSANFRVAGNDGVKISEFVVTYVEQLTVGLATNGWTEMVRLATSR